MKARNASFFEGEISFRISCKHSGCLLLNIATIDYICCRKVIYEEVERVANEEKISSQAAAEIVERRKELAKKTINGYAAMLKNNS